ncbi:hypothetical protein ACLOJK_019994 [Asimina triloba]
MASKKKYQVKDWKPRYLYIRLVGTKGATWDWGVPTRWKDFREVSQGLYSLAHSMPTPLLKTVVTVKSPKGKLGMRGDLRERASGVSSKRPLTLKEKVELKATWESMEKRKRWANEKDEEEIFTRAPEESKRTYGKQMKEWLAEALQVEEAKTWSLVEFKTIIIEDSHQKMPKGTRGKGSVEEALEILVETNEGQVIEVVNTRLLQVVVPKSRAAQLGEPETKTQVSKVKVEAKKA